ncbi:MAG: hypothetical protein WCJ63_09320 [Actinomycetes bacterium]
MRDAAEHVAKHVPPGMTTEESDELQARLTVNCLARVWRRFRIALAADTDPDSISQKIAELADEEGLEKPAPRVPLPGIELDDVHLVCWMGIEAAGSETPVAAQL